MSSEVLALEVLIAAATLGLFGAGLGYRTSLDQVRGGRG